MTNERKEDTTTTTTAAKADNNIMNNRKQTEEGLSWRNLSVQKRNGQVILLPSNGFVSNGSVMAVIGPSGAGKSTFLGALSGTTLKASNLDVTGQVWVDKNDTVTGERQAVSLSIEDGEVAFLTQDSTFFTMLTPREILSFAAFLQLPISCKSSRDSIVDKTISSLGLEHIQHNIVGDRRLGQGISGGEKRRLSVGVELVTTPSVFFADEPTTGLDSGQAEKVVSLMASLAKERQIPAIMVLHQPRTSIWNKLDSFVLLAKGGRVCYIGPRDEALEYFKSIGYEIPPQTNPAEFFIDLVSIDTDDPIQSKADMKRIEYLHSKCIQRNKNQFHEEKEENFHHVIIPSNSHSYQAGFAKRLIALTTRCLKQNFRDKRQNLGRGFASIGLSFLFSTIFKSAGKGPVLAKSMPDRISLLSFAAINMAMMALTKALNLFGAEKPVVNRERTRRQYYGFEYLLSKMIAEIPLDAFFSLMFAFCLKEMSGLRISHVDICKAFTALTISCDALGFAVGSWSSSRESALVMGLPIMVVLMAVGVISPSGINQEDVDNTPPIVKFLQNASPIRHTIEALSIKEFSGLKFEREPGRKNRFFGLPKMGAFALVRNGDQALDAIGLKDKTFKQALGGLGTIAGVNIGIAIFGLMYTRAQFIKAKKNNNTMTEDKERVELDKLLKSESVSTNMKLFVNSHHNNDDNSEVSSQSSSSLKPILVRGALAG